MGWKKLATDYKDISWSGLKKYTQLDNGDGTVSFRDDTHYVNKESSFFGAKDANQINEAVNYILTKLENGTDLYSEFQEFFKTQTQLFISEKDKKFNEMKQSVDTDYSAFGKYLTELKENGDSALTRVETDHRQRMSIYENQQKALFDLWFSAIKDNLSKDSAGKLHLLFEKIENKTDGFYAKETIFSEDGNTITENMGDRKAVTEFVSDNVIVKKLYIKESLILTKTTTFSEDGQTIKEVIT